MSDNKNKNPWGNNHSNDDGGNPWGSGGSGGGGGGQEPPDMDDMLRRAQDNFNSVFPGGVGGGKAILLGLIGILGLWFISGFYVVNPGEQAVVQRFGAWNRTQAEPGLGYHLPFPIEAAAIFNVEEIRKMNIGFDEAFVRSRNGTSVRDIPEESLMLTSDRNIVNLHLEIQWNIKSAEDFVFEIRDQENTIKKVAESAIREVVGQTNMFPIITTDRNEVAVQAREIIQNNLDEYNSGVNITGVLIQTAEVHPDVQQAFQDVQSAKQDAEDTQNRARAYREDILPKSRGAAAQLMQQAQAY
ncbi:MAG: FtsH protease activity modulator HflK, partial [Pseudomonadota bacterium]